MVLLYKRFKDLKPNDEYKITNDKLLEMSEFKFCAFKSLLIKAFGLKENQKTNHRESRRITNFFNPVRNEDINRSLINNNFINGDRNNVLLLNENKNLQDDSDDINDERELHYIDFKIFCDIMKLFNIKYPVDLKIRCNYIIN